MIELILLGLGLSVIYVYVSLGGHLKLNVTNQYDAKKKTITNLKPPEQSYDAATKGYADLVLARLNSQITGLKSHVEREFQKLPRVDGPNIERRLLTLESRPPDAKRPMYHIAAVETATARLDIPFCASVRNGVYLTTDYQTIKFDSYTGGLNQAILFGDGISTKKDPPLRIELMILVKSNKPAYIYIHVSDLIDAIVSVEYPQAEAYYEYGIRLPSDTLFTFEMRSDIPCLVIPFVKISAPPHFDRYSPLIQLKRRDVELTRNMIEKIETFQRSYNEKCLENTGKLDLKLVDVQLDMIEVNRSITDINTTLSSSNLKTTQQDIDTLNTKRDEIKKDLDELVNQCQTLLATVTNSRTQIDEAHREVEVTHDALKNTVKEVVSERLHIENEQTKMHTQMNDLTREGNTAKTIHDKLVSERLAIEKEMTNVQAKITEFENQKQAIEKFIEKLEKSDIKATHSALQDTLKEVTAERQRIETEQTKMQGQLTLLKAEGTTADDRLTNLVDERTKIQAETVNAQSKLKELEKVKEDIVEATDKFDDSALQANTALTWNLTQLKKESEGLREEMDKLQIRISNSQNERGVVDAKIQELHHAARTMILNPLDRNLILDNLEVYIKNTFGARFKMIENRLGIIP